MKFRFPVVIIDEDWRSDSASGLGIRALAKALEERARSLDHFRGLCCDFYVSTP